jgi:hypothetical protein
LGTYGELILANELIRQAGLSQHPFSILGTEQKLEDAIARLPENHPRRLVFRREIANIRTAAGSAAKQLLQEAEPARLVAVRHTPQEWRQGRTGDLVLTFDGRPAEPVSVKTDKSSKAAVSEGQTPHIGPKWAERYFRVSDKEFAEIMGDLGFGSIAELKSNFLNVARFVAEVLIRKLGIVNGSPTDFTNAKPTDLDAVKYLLRQLLAYKHGGDHSRVIVLSRATGDVTWESLLDSIDVDALTLDRVSFRPSKPRKGRSIGSEFAVKVDGRAVVTFQVKHKRGTAHGTVRETEFGDITTRLLI